MPHVALFYRLLVVLWGSWSVCWLAAARGNKTTRRREPWRSRLGYLAPALLGAVLIAWRPVSWRGALAARLWPRSMPADWVGLALVVAGLAFSLWARRHLGRNWSGTVTVKQDHELVRTGPYARVRHPIYTGLLTAALGTAMVAGTAWAALGFVGIAVSLLVKSRIEERFMLETFPGEYPRYRAEVPALIPFTKPRRSARR